MTTPRPPSENCLLLIRVSEGCNLNAYWDVTGFAIGYGHHGSGISSDTTWTRSQADNQLLQDAQSCADEILRTISVSLSQGELDALIDFVYNLGIGRFADSTLCRTIETGDFSSVPALIAEWDHVQGEVNEALQLRRKREIMLWQTGVWS